MAAKKILVLGGALSGPAAATRARETDPEAEITLVGRAKGVNPALDALALRLSGEVSDSRRLEPRRPGYYRNVYGIEVKTGVTVQAIDAEKKKVKTDDGTLAYDALVYALGAQTVWPEVDGLEGASNASALDSVKDLRRVEQLLKQGKKKPPVTILGGGPTGVAAADALARRGAKVTLVEHSRQLLPGFSAPAAARAAKALEARGVEVWLSAAPDVAHRRKRRVRQIQLTDGRTVDTELVLVATGIAPRSELLAEAGAELRDDRTVAIDERCATTLPDVYAAGGVVASVHAITRKPVWTGSAADADKSAQVAGANAAGGERTLSPTLGTTIVRAGDLTLARAGQTSPDLRISIVPGTPTDRSLGDRSKVALTLYFDPKERLRGAEAFGTGGVVERIRVLATAAQGKLRLEQLADLDLGHAATHGPVRDVVNVAGRVASRGVAPVVPWRAVDLDPPPEGVMVIDVRASKARKRGRNAPAGAKHIRLPRLREKAKDFQSQKWVVFVCDTGREAYLAATIAHGLGVNEPGYLSGGLAHFDAELERPV
jgi:NADPH-dependent 2,4-dienoyl-CoA reductase/sulfur reductase-like enzyme/rhodanese-related sulfurtransferase